MPLQAKWELQSHGVTVIECLWNASETMITGRPPSSLPAWFDLICSSADMFRFALDNPSLGSTLVLISSSFTLAYSISVLGARRYRVALISIPDPRNNVLLAQASEVIDWRFLPSRRDTNRLLPAPYPLVIQNSSDRSSPEQPTGIECNPHPGLVNYPHNVAETMEVRKIRLDEPLCVERIPQHSFAMSDFKLAGNNGEQQSSPLVNPNAVQLEPQQPPPVDNRPPSREIEEAILNCPVFEDAEQQCGPRAFDSSGRSVSLLTRPFNRSVSELALCGNFGTVRPRSNSLQDDRCLKSPSYELTLGDHIRMRSLPIPRGTPPLSFGGLGLGNRLNVEASPFIPSPDTMTPPNEPSEDATTTITPLTPDPCPTVEPAEETRPPAPGLERRDSAFSTSSVCSTPSTVKPVVAQAAITKRSWPPAEREFTKGERRAVETVINVLLDRKSKGEARVNPRHLPNLILAKDKNVYKGVGSRGNRFWKLINLGVQMGWLEAGPEDAWVDVGKGWADESSL
jgi:hypothetical protein